MASRPLTRPGNSLRHGLAAVLVFTGAKMIGSDWVHISPGVSVGIIGLVLGVTIAVSTWPRQISESVPR
jgi:tellurite resistance protein TerC